jgi:hypothetical protein
MFGGQSIMGSKRFPERLKDALFCDSDGLDQHAS